MQKIIAVGFDFGGVIEGRPGSVFDHESSQVFDVSLQEFKTAYKKYKDQINSNLISKEDFWMKVAAQLNRSEKYDDFMEYLQNRPAKNINHDVLEIVDALRGRGYKVGILSNNDLNARKGFIAKGIVEHFDAIIISAEVGYSKPDPKIFELFFQELGCPADQCIFVDDTEDSLSTAQEVGFHPILFTDPETLKEKLNQLGVKI